MKQPEKKQRVSVNYKELVTSKNIDQNTNRKMKISVINLYIEYSTIHVDRIAGCQMGQTPSGLANHCCTQENEIYNINLWRPLVIT